MMRPSSTTTRKRLKAPRLLRGKVKMAIILKRGKEEPLPIYSLKDTRTMLGPRPKPLPLEKCVPWALHLEAEPELMSQFEPTVFRTGAAYARADETYVDSREEARPAIDDRRVQRRPRQIQRRPSVKLVEEETLSVAADTEETFMLVPEKTEDPKDERRRRGSEAFHMWIDAHLRLTLRLERMSLASTGGDSAQLVKAFAGLVENCVETKLTKQKEPTSSILERSLELSNFVPKQSRHTRDDTTFTVLSILFQHWACATRDAQRTRRDSHHSNYESDLPSTPPTYKRHHHKTIESSCHDSIEETSVAADSPWAPRRRLVLRGTLPPTWSTQSPPPRRKRRHLLKAPQPTSPPPSLQQFPPISPPKKIDERSPSKKTLLDSWTDASYVVAEDKQPREPQVDDDAPTTSRHRSPYFARTRLEQPSATTKKKPVKPSLPHRRRPLIIDARQKPALAHQGTFWFAAPICLVAATS